MFRRLMGKETPEEKSAREAAAADKAARERLAAAEKEWAKDAALWAKKYPGTPFPAPSPTAALTAPTPHAQPSNLGAMNPVDPNAAANVAPGAVAPAAASQQQQPPQQQLSHEQQLKLEAMQAQQAQAQQQAQNANSNAVSSIAPAPSPVASSPSFGSMGHPAACQDCGQNLSSVLCDDCAAAGAPSLFCVDCDTAFHRPNTKRGSHARRPAPIIPPAMRTEPLPAGVVGTFVPLGMDPNNPSHVSNLHDSSPSPPAAAAAVATAADAQQPQAVAAAAPGPDAQQQQQMQPQQQLQQQQSDQQQLAGEQQQQQQAGSVQPFQPQQQQQQPYADQQQQQQQQSQQQQQPQQMQPQPFIPSDQPDDSQSQQQLQQQQQQAQQQHVQQHWDSPQQPREYASDAQGQQQQQQQQQLQQQPQQMQQRPLIPAVPLALAQDLNQQQMLTPRTAAAAGAARHTPRNADGSINFDASHRHTPRSEAERAASLQQLQQAQQQQPSSAQQSGHHMRHPSLVTSAQNDAAVKDLAPEEVTELRDMFARYDSNGDSYLALDEIGAFLHELEFTYSEQFVRVLVNHVFGLHIHERVVAQPGSGSQGGSYAQQSIKGQLTFPEFLEFMRVFYWLHDAVYAEIDRQFTLAFGREIDDEIVAVLCRFVEFNEHTELDFNEMNRRLVEAVNEEAARAQAEKEEAAAIARGEAPSNSARAREQQREILASPLHQQHLTQARREADMAAGEDARAMEQRRQEEEEWARRQAGEDQQKAALAAQKDQYRQEAFQMQAARRAAAGAGAGDQTNLSPVNEYPDASEDLHSQRGRSHSGQGDEDPFAAHGGSAATIPMRQGPASLLAHSLDASDEAYLQRSWSLLLKHFDRSRSGGISAKDIGQAFRAMGLDPSSAQLNDFFQRADLDGSGSISYPEFKSYYSALFQSYLRRGLDLGQLKKIFASFDEDGDRRVTVAEFRHVVKQICPSDAELSAQDVERLVRLADKNADGVVDFAEFLDLIRISTGEQAPSAAVAGLSAGGDDERARHELLMSYHAARALTRKIIRAYMPSPMEHLFAYAHMPSTFRPSMLARYQTREEFFPSSILNPVLHSTGLHYEQFQMDPRTTMLRATPLHASTGTPNINYLAYHIELEHASGIPLPDVAHRSDIVARRVRVCVLEGGPNNGTPLSNLYMCKGEWTAAEEDRWNFALRYKENDHNAFAFKTTAREATVLFELTCLVKKQASNPAQQQEKNVHPVESSFVEMSCGFATLELDLAQPLQKETRLVLGVLGGNLSQALAIKDSEVLARRSGFKAFTQLFSGPVKSALSLKLSPLSLKEPERFVCYFRLVPCDLILPWSAVEVVKLFLELLAALVLLPQNQPLHMGKSSQLAIQLFLQGSIVDTPDLLQILAELWSDTRKTIKKAALREHDAGAIVHGANALNGGSNDPANDGSSASLLGRFRRTILKLYPAMSMAPGALPPLIVGISDLRRLSLLRALVHVADPLAVLTADGMLRSVATGAAGAPTGVTRAPMSLARAASVQNVRADVAAATNAAAQAAFQSSGGGTGGIGGRRSSGGALTSITIGPNASSPEEALAGLDPFVGQVEFRHIYAPFHTNEISYDPNAHSEEHHLERRSQIQFQLASGGQGQME